MWFSPCPAQNPTHLGKESRSLLLSCPGPVPAQSQRCSPSTCTPMSGQNLPCFPRTMAQPYLTSRSWQDSNLASPMQDLTPPSSLAIAFVGELHHQCAVGSMTMKYNNWATGEVTPTSYMWMAPRLGSSCSPLVFIGPFYMVSLLSLQLSTSCHSWLEHGPIRGMQKSGCDTIPLLANTHMNCIDRQTNSCLCSMKEVT